MHELTLITCTGDRQRSFALCEFYMSRQTCRDFHWIVVDDGNTATSCHYGQEYIRLAPVSCPRESFRCNYTEAINRVATPYFLVIEDDDWYSRWYVEYMRELLANKGACLVGEGRAKFYNIKYRAWKIHNNLKHASLCQTGFKTAEVRELISSYLKASSNPQQLDGAIWKRMKIPLSRMFLVPSSCHCIGIKGVPGRRGLGVDHRLKELQQKTYTFDPDALQLKKWIGEDYRMYEENDAASSNC